MDFSALDLGYTVGRAKLDQCESLTVFSHDLDCFCIPIQYADRLAAAYKRYLIGAGILDWQDDPGCDEQEYECDRHSIGFFHQRDKSPFTPGEFHLGAAIDFTFYEAKVPIHIAIRWCMLMEYIVWTDRQWQEKQDRQQCGPGEELSGKRSDVQAQAGPSGSED